ncbi:universal stress protein [Nocardioides mesophilus]|uniref:Universal stress protein n=1 Tax=Nocardioides mesophilus TaxID=433659 RepID=A0A7G9R8F9_9ACTN|nr:universal stress protein [Nocardioides mesophilus]QNN51884.1 universal stress protein [Nocardioides mesophilus]
MDQAAGTRPGRARPVVLVGVDGTEDGERALRYAVAEAHRRDARLRIVHARQQVALVAPLAQMVPEHHVAEVAQGIVERAVQTARELGYAAPDLECLQESAPVHTALLAHAHDATCVVLGRRGSAARHLATGSTTSAVAALSPVPTIAVPPAWHQGPQHGLVVVGINGAGAEDADGAWTVVRAALAEARSRHARLDVVHAWRPFSQYDAVLDTKALARTWSRSAQVSLTRWMHDHQPGRDVEWVVQPRYQRPAVALHEVSRIADLLVLGRHGRTGLLALSPGSVTRTLLRVSECPVMVVPLPSTAGSDGADADPAASVVHA